MNVYLLHAVIAAVIFLGVLGLLLPQGRSVQVSGAAGVLWLGLLWAAWSGWGWKAAIVALAMSSLYAAVSLPLAGPAARSLFGMEPEESGRGPAPPPEPLRRISEALAEEGPAGPAAAVLLDMCFADPAVRMVLTRHGVSREALGERLELLFGMGAGRWTGEHYLAASALANARALELLLAAGPDQMENAIARIAAHLEYGALL